MEETMDYQQVMTELKRLGTAQNIKIYKRHGAGDNLFGVSFANLNTLKKKIKLDHELALALWESGNTDAQTFATMIADPNRLTPSVADKWVKSIRYYLLSDLLAGLVARTPLAEKKMPQWMKAKAEFVRATGYTTLASMLTNGYDLSENDGRAILKTIEKEIHTSPNRARHSMNSALIAIGVYVPSLRDEVFATAQRIGKVEVDHGETSCKTPDAIAYISKAVAHQKKKAG
jgi:3-methyladenine DNA glycosylase AlkD